MSVAVSISFSSQNSHSALNVILKFKKILKFELNTEELFTSILALVVMLLIVRFFLIIFLNYKLLKFLTKINIDYSNFLFIRYFKLPLNELQSENVSHTIQSLVTSPQFLTTLSLFAMFNILSECIFILALTSWGFIISPSTTLLIVIMFLFAGKLLNSLLISKNSTITLKRNLLWEEAAEIVRERLLGVREIRLNGSENYFRTEFENNRIFDAQYIVKMQLISLLPKYVLELFAFTVFLLIALWQMYVLHEDNAIQTVSFFILGALRLLPSILRLQSSSALLKISRGSGTSALHLSKYIDSRDNI